MIRDDRDLEAGHRAALDLCEGVAGPGLGGSFGPIGGRRSRPTFARVGRMYNLQSDRLSTSGQRVLSR
jgi:hypothetical protein